MLPLIFKNETYTKVSTYLLKLPSAAKKIFLFFQGRKFSPPGGKFYVGREGGRCWVNRPPASLKVKLKF